jgi:hypothetical protein
MVFTIAVRLHHHTFRQNFNSISLALFDCCVDSKEKRASVLGVYEATDILLLLRHATIYRFDATLKSKSAVRATPTVSYVRSILQTKCFYCEEMAWWFEIQGQSKDTKQLSLTLIFSVTRSKHNNNSIMFESHHPQLFQQQSHHPSWHVIRIRLLMYRMPAPWLVLQKKRRPMLGRKLQSY